MLVDVLKILTICYIVILACLDPKSTKALDFTALHVVMFIVATGVFLFVDIVLGVLMFAAFVVTYVLSSTPTTMMPKHSTTPTPINILKNSTEEYQENEKDFCKKPLVEMEDSAKALEKYIVDDFLEKAAEDGIIKDNFDVYPDPLTQKHMNIQGVENDIVGYTPPFKWV
jgi:hypothetical protein